MPAPGRGTEKFQKVSNFPGYVNQPDITNINPGYLIRGSQNVVLKDNNRIGIRKGYQLYGAANTSSVKPIVSSTTFTNAKGTEHMLRAYDDTLEYVYNDTWYTLLDSLTSVDFHWARNDYWNVGEQVSEQLFVDGTANIYSWNGAVTTYASSTSNTITKQGTSTWAEEGFIQGHRGKVRVTLTSNSLTTQALSFDIGSTTYTYTEGTEWAAGADVNASATALSDAINDEDNGCISYAELDQVVISIYDTGDVMTSITGDTNISVPSLPARQVVIGGTTYTYTGGEGTTTLTGVSPSPSGHTAGDPVVQAVITYANDDAKGLPETLLNDVIDVWNNQVVVASTQGQVVYQSAINEIEHYRIRNPRRAGDGARFTLGANIVGIVPQQHLTVFAGKNDIYEISKEEYLRDSDGVFTDTFVIQKAKTSPGEGAQDQRLILPIKNGIIYVSNEPAINYFGSIKDFNQIQVDNISDNIKIDIENFSFTNGSMHYHNRNIYFALPAEDYTLVYDMKDGYWQPPQTLTMRSYQTYNQVLYGHSNLQPETYTMFTGTRDRAISTDATAGFAIPAVAAFSYMNFGDREQFKYFNEGYFEGYMNTGTSLEMRTFYELYGCNGQAFSDINLDANENIFCVPPNEGPLGKTSFGKRGLGNGIGVEDETDLPKVHAIPTFGNTAKQFREMGPQFSSSELDDQWEILSFGFAVSNSEYQSTDIKV